VKSHRSQKQEAGGKQERKKKGKPIRCTKQRDSGVVTKRWKGAVLLIDGLEEKRGGSPLRTEKSGQMRRPSSDRKKICIFISTRKGDLGGRNDPLARHIYEKRKKGEHTRNSLKEGDL